MDLTTHSLPQFVVDASIAVKWHLRDEQDAETAIQVLTDYRDGRISLVPPEQIRYEVPSAIRNALRTRRMTADAGAMAVADFLSWNIPTVTDNALTLNGYRLVIRFGCSFYDGLYVALAERANASLVHAGNRLRNAIGGTFPLEMWMDDYRILG